MAKIGVFWLHNGVVFGKSNDVNSGFEGVPGLVDSQDNHSDVWETDAIPQALAGLEYQDIPRGRVLFMPKQDKHLVYADKTLMNPEGKVLIAAFFDFTVESAIWKRDLHYTTSQEDIDQLFSD